MPVKPVPDGYHTVTPYLVVGDADMLIQFARRAFDATVVHETRRINDLYAPIFMFFPCFAASCAVRITSSDL